MLEAIQELGDSATHDQLKKLKEVLGEDLFNLLDAAFDSSSEEEAKERIDSFVEAAKKSPLKMLKARRVLDADQKKLIMDFMGI